MRFPHPAAATCLACGQPTVVAETALGSVRVHCGTWRWQCDTQDADAKRVERYAVLPTGRNMLATASDQELAA